MVDPPSAVASSPQLWPTTCWSQVGPGAGERALQQLAERYWRPIRAWLRLELRLERDAATERTQDFFLWTIESGLLAKADRERGRFRAFLKTALRHYSVDAQRRAAALRRGGGQRFVPIDGAADDASDSAALDPAHPGEARPDELLDRAWRRELVEAALAALERELAAAGRATSFALFRDYYLDPAADVDYRGLAARHGVTAVDVSNALMRVKRRFRELLRAAVVDTVRDAAELEEELRWLFGKERT